MDSKGSIRDSVCHIDWNDGLFTLVRYLLLLSGYMVSNDTR